MSRSTVGAKASTSCGRSAAHSSLNSPPPRTAPFDQEPAFYEPSGLWLFGNVRALRGILVHVDGALGAADHSHETLTQIERTVEESVLNSGILVTGIHNAAHMRAAVIPLRWGAPRIVVLSGGFKYHLGANLDQEPFPAARLWRHRWDPLTDLAVSRRAPDKSPTFARHNPTIDRLIVKLVNRELRGCLFGNPEF